jgi:hypothetical protein
LKLADFATLTENLDAHSLDLAPDMVKLHDDLARPTPFRSDGGQQSPGALPVREVAGDSKGG